MPETTEELIERTRRERVAIQQRAEARASARTRDSDATLRERNRDAADRVSRGTAEVRSDYHDPRFARARERNRVDPLDSERIRNIESDLASQGRELARTSRLLAARRVTGGGAMRGFEGRFATPEGQAYQEKFYSWFRSGAEGLKSELRDLGIKAKITTESDPDGAFFIPPEVEKNIQRVLAVISAMRTICRVRGLSTAIYKKPVNIGGSTVNWVGERQARTETNTPKLKMLEFPIFEMEGEPSATQTALDDMDFDVESWLAEELSVAIAEAEGDSFLNGDGVVKPRGLLTYSLVANTSYDKTVLNTFGYVPTGVAADISDETHNGADQIIDLITALRRPYRANAQFLLNELTRAAVRKLKDSQGRYLTLDSIKAGEPDTLFGYPMETDENMPDIGANKTPMLFGDFQQTYLILDRVGIRVLRDPFTNKPYIMFYTTKRVGGGAQWFEAMKFLKVAAS